ncbi:hypothetical protein [Sphaerisporangium album]|nr:hypothetical protein [Sphaerisporangium album]
MAEIHRRPGSYGLDGSYRAFTTFIAGFHAGSGHTLLAGFREWLIVQVNGGNNLVWEALVLMLAFPTEARPLDVGPIDGERNGTAVAVLFRALDQFLAHHEEHLDGLALIYADHAEWLQRQSWARP